MVSFGPVCSTVLCCAARFCFFEAWARQYRIIYVGTESREERKVEGRKGGCVSRGLTVLKNQSSRRVDGKSVHRDEFVV